jgi:nicotinamide-nucleotide amidase
VSAESAAEMAKGALARSVADIAIAITGIAGPVATGDKPEGLVWFAVATGEHCHTAKREFGAIGRAHVRQASIETALDMLGKVLALPSK